MLSSSSSMVFVRRHCASRNTSWVFCLGCAPALYRSSSLTEQRRAYQHQFPDNFVPEGATTSRFQSSIVPSERVQVIREYALAPLFGARRSCCLLGSTLPVKTLVELKPRVRVLMAAALGVPVEHLEVGSLIRLADKLLPRPREANAYRVDRTTGRTVATTLIPVFLREDAYDEQDVQDLGEMFIGMMNLALASPLSSSLSTSAESVDPDDRHTIDELLTVGVSYAELEAPDASDVQFDTLAGQQVTDEIATMIESRWRDRVDAFARRQEMK